MTKAGLVRFDALATGRQSVVRGIAILALALMGAGASQAGTVAIGAIGLSYSGGNQELAFYNLTGSTTGCQAFGPQYGVCNGITIDSWTLTLTFTSAANTDPITDTLVSPLTISSQGNTNEIPPFDGSTPYTGGAVTWQIPLIYGDPGEPACPPCDYELTQVEFAGTIDAGSLPLYVGSDLNTGLGTTDTSFNALPAFDDIIVWQNGLSADYSGIPSTTPQGLLDFGDVLVTDQLPSSSGTPEPGSLLLMGGGILAVLLLKRLRTRDHFGCG